MADLNLASVSLQEAYNEGPEIIVNNVDGGAKVRDAVVPLSEPLLAVTNNDGTNVFGAIGPDQIDVGRDVVPTADDTYTWGSFENRMAGVIAARIGSVAGFSANNVISDYPGFLFGVVDDETGIAQLINNLGVYPGVGGLTGGRLYSSNASGSAIIRNADQGCIVGGVARQSGGGDALVRTQASYGEGSFTWGVAGTTSSTDATLHGGGYGGFSQGFSYSKGASGNSIIGGYGPGCFTQGAVYSEGDGADGSIYSYGGGSFSQGFVSLVVNSSGPGIIHTGAYGSFAQGFVETRQSGTGGCEIYAYGNGAFAQGATYKSSNGTNASCRILSSGQGSFAQGFSATISGSALAGSTIEASGDGSFAHGLSFSSGILTQIQASGSGSFAVGRSVGGGVIQATASASFAFGDATASGASSIYATAANCAQWFAGTNALADSLQVGETGTPGGVRLCAGGVPGTPRTGDIWNANGYVYIHSNGNNVRIDGPGPLTN